MAARGDRAKFLLHPAAAAQGDRAARRHRGKGVARQPARGAAWWLASAGECGKNQPKIHPDADAVRLLRPSPVKLAFSPGPTPLIIVELDEPPPSWHRVQIPKLEMYPKGSPKYNLLQSSSAGKKKSSPKITKKGEKPRAQWNPSLEKALVEILHEHNNPYHRGQNGWNGETWNMMVNIFHARHKHVNLTKTQIQDKEKELKRDYKMLKEARKQSGAG